MSAEAEGTAAVMAATGRAAAARAMEAAVRVLSEVRMVAGTPGAAGMGAADWVVVGRGGGEVGKGAVEAAMAAAEAETAQEAVATG